MTKLNPVDYAVISQALLSSAREMGVKLCRSAYSSIVRDAKDASTGILNEKGESVAQSDELIPILVGSLSLSLKRCLAYYKVSELQEGDFFISNHPYEGCHHLNDTFLFMPIFWDGEVIGFSAAVAHQLDFGGSTTTGNMATDLYQEGLIIPPLKFNVAKDWDGGALERLIAANVRVPSQTIGDISSQFAACNTGIIRVRELCEKFGGATVRTAMADMLDYAERRVRAAIASIPNGIYTGEDILDHDGVTPHELKTRATVTVEDDSLTVDFAGTSPQAKSNVNAPFASTVASTLTALKDVLTGGDVPYNEGAFRPFTITAPAGSLLNPTFPAPVAARMEVIYRAFDSVLKAFGRAIPERVIACGYDSTYATALSLLKPEGYSVFMEVHGSGWGASTKGPGVDAVAQPLSNCTNVPVELVDMGYDFFRIERYEIIHNSGGAGLHRGGHGTVRAYRILKDGVRFSIVADRFVVPAAGINGGLPGAPAGCEVHRGDEVITHHSLASETLREGDLLVVRTGGGGGYGAPLAA